MTPGRSWETTAGDGMAYCRCSAPSPCHPPIDPLVFFMLSATATLAVTNALTVLQALLQEKRDLARTDPEATVQRPSTF